MIIQDSKDLKKLQEIGEIVANCLKTMIQSAEPGMSTLELDKIGASYLSSHAATSAPIKDYQFPGTTCISVNQCAAHGIPSAETILKDGDLINIDVSAVKNGIYGDTGSTFGMGSAATKYKDLMKSTRQTLNRAADRARAGEKLSVIGKTIEKGAGNKFSVIRNLCSHGIGKSLHEEPDQILPYFDPRDPRYLQEHMVITIEPFLSTGTTFVDDGTDGWALLNKKGCYSAQYEHTMVIRKGRSPLIVTQPTI